MSSVQKKRNSQLPAASARKRAHGKRQGLALAPRWRAGWGLIHTIAAIGLSAVTLSIAVPMFLAAQRQADLTARQAAVTAQAREVEAHFREDVRAATAVETAPNGNELDLTLTHPAQPEAKDHVTYRWTTAGLQRELRPGTPARSSERYLYGAPLAEARFRRAGKSVELSLQFVYAGPTRRNRRELRLLCSATPRSLL